MTDLITELRQTGGGHHRLRMRAADEIARLQAALADYNREMEAISRCLEIRPDDIRPDDIPAWQMARQDLAILRERHKAVLTALPREDE